MNECNLGSLCNGSVDGRKRTNGSSFSVILCLAIVSVTYVVSTMVDQLQRDTSHDPAAVEVRFSQGFFLIVSAGFASVAATATSLFRYALFPPVLQFTIIIIFVVDNNSFKSAT